MNVHYASFKKSLIVEQFQGNYLNNPSTCRKIPKISPGACIFQRPFLRGLFLELLLFVGVYARREVCVSNSIGLAYS